MARLIIGMSALVGTTFGVMGCRLMSDYYYRDYTATCTASSANDIRGIIQGIAADLSRSAGVPATVIVDRSDLFVEDIELPEIPGAPPYRPKSSGQMRLSFTPNARLAPPEISVVLIKTPHEEDELGASMTRLIEREITEHNCGRWIIDKEHSVLM